MDPAMLAMLMQQMGGGGGQSGMMGGASQFLSGLFGNSGEPYKQYGQQYNKYNQQAQGTQNPFYNAGTQAMGNYQNWAQGQQDPSGFINHLMNNYQQSPYAKFEMQQGQRAGNNAASASGLIGSTPYMQASQDYARNISSQDQNQWLQNVLGVNQQYGQSQQNLMQGGQNSANILSQLQESLGQNMGAARYGQSAGDNMDRGNMMGGGLKFLFG